MTILESGIHAVFDTEFADLIGRLQQSTVQVQGSRAGMGSGIIWHADGLILTNAHVVRGRGAIVRLSDGRSLNGQVILKDIQQDLAALVIPTSHLPAAPISQAAPIRAGELVVAIGNPQGLTNAVSVGVVHTTATDRHRTRWIQADMRLAPGYSGGPLATVQGEVIGMNSMIVDGRAFAISRWAIERFLASQQERPYLGVTLQPVQVMQHQQLMPGWVIMEVADQGPAAFAGVLLGDIWLGINNRPFITHADLNDWLSLAAPGDRWTISVLRGQQQMEYALEMGHRGAEREAA
ncbi:MAG: hypothetical protein Kow00121_09450 [Elainellaceae cyanobacterium]